MSGFNLPPGCSNRDIENSFGIEGPCECCGKDIDNCICPECPVCSTFGDKKCYCEGGHGLVYTPEQLAGQAELKKYMEEMEEHYRQLGDAIIENEKAANEYWNNLEIEANNMGTNPFP